MEKLVPPDIFLLKTDEEADLMINIHEFYEILMKTLQRKPAFYSLTFPETIIKGSALGGSFLIHMDEEKLVYSPDLSKHTIDKFYKRCSFYRIKNTPLCICKPNFQKNDEKCMVLHTISECTAMWKKFDSVIIQRYVGLGTDPLFKARIVFHTKKNTFSGKLLWKDFDSSCKISRDEEAKEEEISVNEDLKEQMRDLYEMLQNECLRAEVVEIAADFLQNDAGKWYFIEMLYGKLQIMEKKNLASGNKKEIQVSESKEIHEEVNNTDLQEEAIKDLEMLMKGSAGGKHNKKKKKKLKRND